MLFGNKVIMHKALIFTLFFLLVPYNFANENENVRDALEKAVQTEFSSEFSSSESASKKALGMYKKLIEKFPDARNEVIVAKGNMARIYAYELDQFETAKAMYEELLANEELPDQNRKIYYRGYARSLAGGVSTASDLRQHIRKSEHQSAQFHLMIAHGCLVRFVMSENSAEAYAFRDLAADLLSDILMNEQNIQLSQGMVAKDLLMRIPFYELNRRYIALYGKGENPSGAMIEPIVLTGGRVTYKFPVQAPFDYSAILDYDAEEAAEYILTERGRIINAAISLISSECENGKLGNKTDIALGLLAEFAGTESVPILRRLLPSLESEEDRTKLLRTIEYLTKLKKVSEDSANDTAL